TSTVGQMGSPDGAGPLGIIGGFQAVRTFHAIEAYQVAADHYLVYRSPRPWWAWQGGLAPHERPVDLARTAWLLGAVSLLGLGLMAAGSRRSATAAPRDPAGSPDRQSAEAPHLTRAAT